MILRILGLQLCLVLRVVAEYACRRNYRFRLTDTLVTFKSPAQFSAWSGGGGGIRTLPSDTNALFGGREFGSGDRHSIYGSRAYGSGYPYGAVDASTVVGRPFPYGSWPIYWGGNYAGSDEYSGPTADVQRPGGRLVSVALTTTDSKWNATGSGEEYHLIGDHDSVTSIMTSLVDWCQVVPKWPTLFKPGSPGSQSDSLRPENVMQYYRASSFALAFKQYNNTYANPPLNTSTALTHDQSTPLASTQTYSPWLKCLNETIGTALPILNREDKSMSKKKLQLIIGLSIGLGTTVLSVLCGLAVS